MALRGDGDDTRVRRYPHRALYLRQEGEQNGMRCWYFGWIRFRDNWLIYSHLRDSIVF